MNTNDCVTYTDITCSKISVTSLQRENFLARQNTPHGELGYVTTLKSNVLKLSTFVLMDFQGNLHALLVACKKLGLEPGRCWGFGAGRETHLAVEELQFFAGTLLA